MPSAPYMAIGQSSIPAGRGFSVMFPAMYDLPPGARARRISDFSGADAAGAMSRLMKSGMNGSVLPSQTETAIFPCRLARATVARPASAVGSSSTNRCPSELGRFSMICCNTRGLSSIATTTPPGKEEAAIAVSPRLASAALLSGAMADSPATISIAVFIFNLIFFIRQSPIGVLYLCIPGFRIPVRSWNLAWLLL